ncbi:MAG: aggregation factor core [Pseudomonadota bacterium]
MLKLGLAAALLLLAYTSVNASIDIKFTESAPKDRFSITNQGKCTFNQIAVSIDLSSSSGKLFFDTSAQGDGVDVFQPFEASQGEYALVSQRGGETVIDGDNQLTLLIETLVPGDRLEFTIDVDDRLPNSALGQTQISSAEIEGAVAKVTMENAKVLSAFFDLYSMASIEMPSCH